jgi:hypothetical protein
MTGIRAGESQRANGVSTTVSPSSNPRWSIGLPFLRHREKPIERYLSTSEDDLAERVRAVPETVFPLGRSPAR